MNRLLNEMESQKELLLTYEQTLKHKDSIVANMTHAINKQVWYMVLTVHCVSGFLLSFRITGTNW